MPKITIIPKNYKKRRGREARGASGKSNQTVMPRQGFTAEERNPGENMEIKRQYEIKDVKVPNRGKTESGKTQTAEERKRAEESRKTSSQKRSQKGKLTSGKITVRRTISAASYMIKVAQAKTPTQVAAVIRTAQADLRFVKSCNSDTFKQETASRIISRVVVKSRLKISRLRKEADLEHRRKLAGKKIRRQITEELIKKRRKRKAQEALDTKDPERVTLEKNQECEDLSRQEAAALSGDTAALLELAGTAAAAVPMADRADASAAGGETCGSMMDVTV